VVSPRSIYRNGVGEYRMEELIGLITRLGFIETIQKLSGETKSTK
jgi:hypothetical protein